MDRGSFDRDGATMSGRSKDGGLVGETEGEKKTVNAPRQLEPAVSRVSPKICVSLSTNPTSVEIQPQKGPVTWTLNDMVVSTELEKELVSRLIMCDQSHEAKRRQCAELEDEKKELAAQLIAIKKNTAKAEQHRERRRADKAVSEAKKLAEDLMKANEKTREAKQRFNDEHRRAEDAVASAAQLYEDLAVIKVNAEEAEERCEAERGRAEEAVATSLKLTVEANNAEQRHEANRLRLEKSLAEEVASKASLAMNLKKAEEAYLREKYEKNVLDCRLNQAEARTVDLSRQLEILTRQNEGLRFELENVQQRCKWETNQSLHLRQETARMNAHIRLQAVSMLNHESEMAAMRAEHQKALDVQQHSAKMQEMVSKVKKAEDKSAELELTNLRELNSGLFGMNVKLQRQAALQEQVVNARAAELAQLQIKYQAKCDLLQSIHRQCDNSFVCHMGESNALPALNNPELNETAASRTERRMQPRDRSANALPNISTESMEKIKEKIAADAVWPAPGEGQLSNFPPSSLTTPTFSTLAQILNGTKNNLQVSSPVALPSLVADPNTRKRKASRVSWADQRGSHGSLSDGQLEQEEAKQDELPSNWTFGPPAAPVRCPWNDVPRPQPPASNTVVALRLHRCEVGKAFLTGQYPIQKCGAKFTARSSLIRHTRAETCRERHRGEKSTSKGAVDALIVNREKSTSKGAVDAGIVNREKSTSKEVVDAGIVNGSDGRPLNKR